SHRSAAMRFQNSDGCWTTYASPYTGGPSRYEPQEDAEMPRDYELMCCEHAGDPQPKRYTTDGVMLDVCLKPEPAIREYFAFKDDVSCVYVCTSEQQPDGSWKLTDSTCAWCD